MKYIRKGTFMNRSFVLTVLVVTALSVSAIAGTIEGKVSPGKSVVYVDTIQGKTFPAPSQQPVMDQKGLAFSPHVMVVQVGTTVEFLNSDNVQHNVFWPSISGIRNLPTISAPGPRARSAHSNSITPAWCRCFATFTRRCRAISSSARHHTLRRPTPAGTTKSTTFPTANTTWSPGMKA